jgi:hypothetical protein
MEMNMTSPIKISATYADLANDALRRGLYPTPPIDPREKGPRYTGWPELAVHAAARPDLRLVETWAAEHESWNCGVVAQPETPYFNLDSDDLDALHAEWATFSNGQPFPPTLFVYSRTDDAGHRRGHYHFLKTPYSNEKLGHVTNHGLAPAHDLTNQFAELQYTAGQCVWAGSIHSKTGQPLRIENDIDMQPVPNAFVDFLASLPRANRRGHKGGGFTELSGSELAEMGPNSGRHQYLDSCAGRWAGNEDPVELQEKLQEVNEKFAEPVEDDYIERLASDFAYRRPAGQKTYVMGTTLTTDKEEYDNWLAQHPKVDVRQPVIDISAWPALFHSYEEAITAPPLTFAIEGFLQEGGITFLGGLAGHGKTLVMLNIAKALLEGHALFGHEPFRVMTSKRVLYLIPESGLGPFVHRLKVFRLLDQVKAGRLFFRTLSAKEQIELNDPRLLKAAEGADVFLDTAVRFMTGEENSASDHRKFADLLFNLQRVGARTVTGAHHSPKAFEKQDSLSLENAFRGSGDVGAMLATAWALRQTDFQTNRILIKNVKPRDFEPCQPFEIEGRPWIDQTGAFKIVSLPGMARPRVPKLEKPELLNARLLRGQGLELADIAAQVGVGLRTIERWSSEGKLKPTE